MSNPSASSSRHYQVIRKLERNAEQGQVLYLAKDNTTKQPVVLTRFILSQFGFNQYDYEAFQQEVQVLKGLNHPGIPRYLDSFKTTDSFCLIQEYKNAESLAVARNFTLEEIKKIAVSLLEILVYLHNHIPCVIHRNIQPESVLVDDQLNVYLVDFGLPIMRGQVEFDYGAGTLGFKAPEQLYHRQITEATDLYHLGVTLICLLTKTKSTEIHTLIDKQDRINFQHLAPISLSQGFINWLDKMVQSNRKERYSSAAVALEALNVLEFMRLPEVKFIPSVLEFKANKFGEKLTQPITVSNSIPDTVLKGTWKVTLHPHDPICHSGSHAWIFFEPAKFESNYAKCQITVDTSKLRSSKTYKRQIVLHANTSPTTHSLPLNIKTAAIETKQLPFVSLIAVFVMAVAGGWLEAWALGGEVSLLGYVVGFFIGLLVAAMTGILVKQHRKRGFSGILAVGIAIATTALGMCIGIGLKLGFSNLFLQFALVGTGLPLSMMIVWSLFKQARRILKYRRSERYLVKP
ncbi:MAG TPA: hypothetical protein DCP31_22165 [Cyanobacteria bacterium UBA8543]|nr:hypothetical protein [Cyanobacteria bacterium UBA8543]